MIALGYIVALAYAALCVGLGSVLYLLGAPRAYTRKVVHILIGAEWFILYRFMGNGIHFFLVALICTLLLLLEYRFKAVPAVSSDGDNSPGTVYYGVSMTLLAAASYFVPELMMPFGIAVLCTSLGDGAAGVLGQLVKHNNPTLFRRKTLAGYLANLAFSFASALAFKVVALPEITLLGCLIIALASAGVELVSVRGTDNILVPLSVTLTALALLKFPVLEGYLLAVALIPTVAAVLLHKRALSSLGTVCAAVLGVLTLSAFKNGGFLLLLLYFGLAHLTDKIKCGSRGRAGDLSSRTDFQESESHTRGSRQVVANGLAAAVCAVLYLAFENDIFAVGFIAAVAEALSDTAASGIGTAWGRAYDPVRGVRCESGESGGVSVIGTLAGLIFAAGFSFVGAEILGHSIAEGIVAASVAFFGMLLDSLFGSLLQAKYRCPACGRRIETNICCGREASLISGVGIITNSTVNLLCSTFSAIAAVVIALFI